MLNALSVMTNQTKFNDNIHVNKKTLAKLLVLVLPLFWFWNIQSYHHHSYDRTPFGGQIKAITTTRKSFGGQLDTSQGKFGEMCLQLQRF